MKYLPLVLLLCGCSHGYYISYKVGECYGDYRDRVIRINSEYKGTWLYQLYLDGKDVGEFQGPKGFTEAVYEFKRECPNE